MVPATLARLIEDPEAAVRVQQHPQPRADDLVIVGQDDRDRRRTSGTGTSLRGRAHGGAIL